MKHALLTRYTHLLVMPKRKALVLTLLGVTMTLGAITGLATSKVDVASKHEDSNTGLVASRLDDLQTQLISLKEAVKKPLPDMDNSAIAAQITRLSARLETLKSVESDALNQTLTKTLTHTESTLGSQLDSIKEVINRLDAKEAPKTYLSPDKLPFKVVSVDSIQQIPVASIHYDFKTVPLEKGERLAGWKVVALDYSKQRVELENSNNERVLLTHEHIG